MCYLALQQTFLRAQLFERLLISPRERTVQDEQTSPRESARVRAHVEKFHVHSLASSRHICSLCASVRQRARRMLACGEAHWRSRPSRTLLRSRADEVSRKIGNFCGCYVAMARACYNAFNIRSSYTPNPKNDVSRPKNIC